MSKRAFIFDFDGTICDSFSAFITVLNDLAPTFQYKTIKATEIDALRELHIRELLAHLGISLTKLPFVLRSARRKILSHHDSLAVFPKMGEVLASLRQNGVEVGCLSSNSEELISSFFKRKTIAMDFIQGGSSIFGKAQLLKKVLKKRNLNPEVDEIFYVGDEIRDIEAARKVSIKIVSVGWGYNTASRLRKENPDHLVSSPSEILSLINLKKSSP